MVARKPTPEYIAEGLHVLAVPIGDVKPLEGNPRRGDVAAVARSLERFGQRKPIVVHRGTGEVEAGNHTLAAAQSLEWEYIAVVYVDDSDDEAKAFALADNRTGDLGGYDDESLAAMIKSIAHDEALLEATSYDFDFLADLEPKEPGNHGRGLGESVISYQIVFDTDEQQQRWYGFMRHLRGVYDGDTNAERLDAYLADKVPEAG